MALQKGTWGDTFPLIRGRERQGKTWVGLGTFGWALEEEKLASRKIRPRQRRSLLSSPSWLSSIMCPGNFASFPFWVQLLSLIASFPLEHERCSHDDDSDGKAQCLVRNESSINWCRESHECEPGRSESWDEKDGGPFSMFFKRLSFTQNTFIQEWSKTWNLSLNQPAALHWPLPPQTVNHSRQDLRFAGWSDISLAESMSLKLSVCPRTSCWSKLHLILPNYTANNFRQRNTETAAIKAWNFSSFSLFSSI